MAATTVAKRVAEELRCPLGQDVGYSIRFEDVTSAATKIKFLTDGLLLREALVDPLLSRYSVIMVDEAHERSLSSDLLLGVLKKIRRKRPELRIVVSSATIEAERFLDFFVGEEDAATTAREVAADPEQSKVGRIVSIEGRAFPVDIHYLAAPCEDYLERAVQTVFDIHASEPTGDILVFLTGRDEIESALQLIGDRLPTLPTTADKILALPLYAGLTADQQMYVFEPAPDNHRKVIFATNIAEASVTINGIAYVIDSGFVKLRAFNPTTGIDTLTPTPVSKASATQRAGRAGRTKPGKCYRLYPESNFIALPATTVPELQRSDLAPTILQLKALGIDNIARFPFLTPPPSALLIRALDNLYALGALDPYAKLTNPLGTRMADLPLKPMLAKALLASPAFACQPQLLSIAAMLTVQSPLWTTQHEGPRAEDAARAPFAVEEGDHLTLLNIFHAFTTPPPQARSQSQAGQHTQTPKWCHRHSLNFQTLTTAVSVRKQLSRALERYGVLENQPPSMHSTTSAAVGDLPLQVRIRRCLAASFFPHAARMQADGTFRTVAHTGPDSTAMILHPHPSSLFFRRKADWVVFDSVEEGKGGKIFVRGVSSVEMAWLREGGGEFFRSGG